MTRTRLPQPPRVGVARLGRRTRKASQRCFEGVDAVINLAGEPINQRWNDEVKDRIARSRIKATKNLVAKIAALDQRPKTLISASAIGYYGDRGDELGEDAEPGDDFTADIVVRWKKRPARPRITACGWRRSAPATCSTPGRVAEGTDAAVQGRGWRADRRRQAVHVLGPPARRDRDPALGPKRVGQRTGQRDGTQPGNQQGILESTRQAAGRPSFLPVPGFAIDIVKGGGVGHAAREGQRVSQEGDRRRLRVQNSRNWLAPSPTCSTERSPL